MGVRSGIKCATPWRFLFQIGVRSGIRCAATWWSFAEWFLCRPGSMDPESRPSLLVTFDLGSAHYYNRMVIFNQLNGGVNSGRMGSYSVSAHGFTFRPLEGEQLIYETVNIWVFTTYDLPHFKTLKLMFRAHVHIWD